MTITCKLARTTRDMDEVCRIRYECYHRGGSIAARADQRFRDHYDDLPNHFSFLLHSPGEGYLATVRISVVRPDLGWREAPSTRVFTGHPAIERMTGESFVEASRLCFHRQARRDVLYRLVANLAALADQYETAWLVACPRPEHSPIYQRMFGFRPLAPARQYFGVSFSTELLGLRREELRRTADRFEPMRKAWHDAASGTILARIPEQLLIAGARARLQTPCFTG